MRSCIPYLALLVVACGSPAESFDDGGLGGAGGDPSPGGSSGGTDGSSPGTGGRPGSGGATGAGGTGAGGDTSDTGGAPTSGGAPATGGDSSGGSGGSSGGSPGSGGAPALHPCNPPPLTAGEGIGMDQNNLCGWDFFGEPKPPTGYGSSITTPVNCADPHRLIVDLVNQNGIRYSTWVEIIDPADRCTTGPMAGVDRRFTIPAGYCVRISSPFEGFQVGLNPDPSGCATGLAGAFDAKISEPGWVRVDTAALVGGQCPLSCD